MKKVKVIKAYFDKRQDRYPNLGETFEVEESRCSGNRGRSFRW